MGDGLNIGISIPTGRIAYVVSEDELSDQEVIDLVTRVELYDKAMKVLDCGPEHREVAKRYGDLALRRMKRLAPVAWTDPGISVKYIGRPHEYWLSRDVLARSLSHAISGLEGR